MLFILSILSGIKSFIVSYWRVIIPLAIVVVGIYKVNHLREQRDDAIMQFTNYKLAINQQIEKDNANNLVKLAQAKTDITTLQITHIHELQTIIKQRDIENKDKSLAINELNKNEAKHAQNDEIKTTDMLGDIVALRNQLREQVSADATNKSTSASDTKGLTKTGRECDPAVAGQYDTLKSACALTTSDFNYCRGILDAHCKQFECKDDQQ